MTNLTLSSSKSILQSSHAVLERSLELLSTLERLQLELQEAITEKQCSSDEDAEKAVEESENQDQPDEEGTSSDSSSDDTSGDESDAVEQQAKIEEVVVEVEG